MYFDVKIKHDLIRFFWNNFDNCIHIVISLKFLYRLTYVKSVSFIFHLSILFTSSNLKQVRNK